MADELYHDIKAVEKVSKQLALPDSAAPTHPSAMERGMRERPDGTVERYERLEFD